MNILKEPFAIDVNFEGETRRLQIYHQTETFDLTLEGSEVSLINNGDNSWSIVAGIISQEQANLIGAEIEKHHENLI